MKRRSILQIASLMALGVASASLAQSEGRTYSLGNFDSIDISGSAVVRFVQGPRDEVIVEGDDSVQKGVELEVRNGTLSILHSGAWKFWNARQLQLVVSARSLKRVNISGAADLHAPSAVKVEKLSIDISGAGTARFEQLHAQQLDFHVSGAGDGAMAGQVESLNLRISGKSRFTGGQLAADRARVTINGVGRVEVWSASQLDVAINGVGTVDYWGSPSVKRSISGRGEINERGKR